MPSAPTPDGLRRRRGMGDGGWYHRFHPPFPSPSPLKGGWSWRIGFEPHRARRLADPPRTLRLSPLKGGRRSSDRGEGERYAGGVTSRVQNIRNAFESDPYTNSQGFRLIDVTDNEIVVAVTVRHDQVNFHGGTHGGVLFSLADCAFSLASNAHGDPAVAIDTHLAITAPSGVGEDLTATAREMTRGRTLATYRVDVTRGDGRIVGLFTGTVFVRSAEG